MEPNYPSQTVAQPPSGETPQPKTGPRKLLFIVASVVLVAIVGVVIVLLGRGSGGGANQDRASLYIEREGFEASDSIGDPLALISKPTSQVVQYGGSPVIQPCTVLTVKDVRDSGLKIAPTQLTTAVERVFFDGQGTAPLSASNELSLPLTSDANHCQYRLTDSGAAILTVYQPGYASEKAVDREVARNYVQHADTAGLKTFKRKTETGDTATYLLRGTGVSAELRITAKEAAATVKLLQRAAQNLAAAITAPTPIEQFAYDSPIFTGSTVAPCTLTDADAFKVVLSTEAGPLVEESVSSAVGVIQNSSGDKMYNFVSGECKRRSPEGSTRDKTLTVEVTTYEAEEGAIAATTYEQNGSAQTQDLQKITPTIGDESYFANVAGMDNALIVRKGRVVVRMSYFIPKTDDSITAEQRIEAMKPVVQDMVTRHLKNF